MPDGARPPLWWTLVRHEWRLTSRDFFNLAGRKKRDAARPARKPRGRVARIVWLVLAAIALHAIGLVTLALPRTWHDTAAARLAVVAATAFVFSFLLSYTMSRIVAAFHERRDLDLLLSAPIDPMLVLAIRTLTVVVAATATFAIFVYPVLDVGVVTGHWWMARYYVVLPLLAIVATSIALIVTDLVVRLIGVRRARVGLQVFSALVGASMYFVSQARNFVSAETSHRMTAWFMDITRVDDAPWPVTAIAAVARGDVVAWLAFAGLALAAFVGATAWSRRRFVEIAQTPDSSARAARVPAAVVDRRFASGFRRGSFATLVVKEWRLIARAPQLVSQVLLQLLYLMPLLFVAARQDHGAATSWGAPALAGGITGIASTLATSLAWLTVAAEDAPDLIAGSPRPRAEILAAKLLAASLPPIAIVVVAALASARSATTSAAGPAIILVFGVLACISAAILAAAAPVGAKRSDFQSRHKGRGVSAIVEAFQFLLWAGAAGTASSGHWWVSLGLTALAMVMPALRLPRALRQFDA